MLPAGSSGSVWDAHGRGDVAVKGIMHFGQIPV